MGDGGVVDNFREVVENLLRAARAEGGAKPRFQSIQGVILRSTPHPAPRHAASRGERRRIPDCPGPPAYRQPRLFSPTRPPPRAGQAVFAVFRSLVFYGILTGDESHRPDRALLDAAFARGHCRHGPLQGPPDPARRRVRPSIGQSKRRGAPRPFFFVCFRSQRTQRETQRATEKDCQKGKRRFRRLMQILGVLAHARLPE